MKSEQIRRFGNFILWGVSFYLIFLIFTLYRAALLYAPINSDAGNSLSVAEKIRLGAVPYKDFSTGYAPLGFYILAAMRNLTPSGWPSYEVYLGIILLFLLAQSVLIVLILKRAEVSWALSTFTGTLAAVRLIGSQGNGVFLEPFVSFFLLLAVLFIQRADARRNLILGGFCCCCAALSKQYGVLALPASCLYINLIEKSFDSKMRKLAFFGAGFLIPILLALIYFCAIHGSSPLDICTQLLLRGYESHAAFNYHKYKEFILYKYPFVLLFLLAMRWSSGERRGLLYLTTGMLLFMSAALYMRSFTHYYILIIGAAAIAQTVAIVALREARPFFAFLIPLLVVFTLWEAAKLKPPKRYALRERDAQLKLAAEVNKSWPRGTAVLIYGPQHLFFSAGLNPIDDKEPAFAFLSNFNPKEQLEFISKAERILIDRNDHGYFGQHKERLEPAFGSFDEILKSHRFSMAREIEPAVELWERR